jgi:hypothetical protein
MGFQPQHDRQYSVEKSHDDKAGKPKLGAAPTRLSHRVTETVIPIDSEIATQRGRFDRFSSIQKIVNLTDEREYILRFFSDACRRDYLLPTLHF